MNSTTPTPRKRRPNETEAEYTQYLLQWLADRQADQNGLHISAAHLAAVLYAALLIAGCVTLLVCLAEAYYVAVNWVQTHRAGLRAALYGLLVVAVLAVLLHYRSSRTEEPKDDLL